MASDVLNNIGRTRITVENDGRNSFDRTFLLSEQNGWQEKWTREGHMIQLQTVGITNPQMKEVPFKVGHWGFFWHSWKNLPLPVSEAKALFDLENAIINGVQTSIIRIWPKFTTEPDRFFVVNNITEALELNNHDSSIRRGNFGLYMAFKTVATEFPISVKVPTDTPSGGGNVFWPIEGGM